MENADAADPTSRNPMSASFKLTSRRSPEFLSLQGFSLLYMIIVFWTAVSGIPEGRFQQTSHREIFAASSVVEFSGPQTRELFWKNSFDGSAETSSASHRNIRSYIDLDRFPHEGSLRSKSTEDSDHPVLNLTLATIRFTRDLKNDNGIMGLNSGDFEDSSRKSDLASESKKYKGVREYVRAKISSVPNFISEDVLARRVAPDTGRNRLSFLRDLKGSTRKVFRTTKTPSNFASERQDYETTLGGEETSTEMVTGEILERMSLNGTNLPANSVKPAHDMLGMIRKLKGSTAIPQSEVSDAIESRSGKATDSATVEPKTGLSSKLRNFLKKGVRSSNIKLRVGSLANDSIGLLPENKTQTNFEPSIRSNSFVAENSSTSLPSKNFSSESTTSPQIATTVVGLKLLHNGTTEKSERNTTLFPKLKVNDKTVLTTDAPLETTEVAHTTTANTTKSTTTTTTFTTTTETTTTTAVATTPRSFLRIHRNETFEHSNTTSSRVNHTEKVPVTEFLQTSSSLPTSIPVSTTEKSGALKSTKKFTDQTSTDIQTTTRHPLNRTSTKVSTNFQLITDDQGLDQNSTETPHAGQIVEKELLTVYTDTAGLTVCLVILCVGLLIFVVGIYFVCQSSKRRDSDDNVQPYSARRVSDA